MMTQQLRQSTSKEDRIVGGADFCVYGAIVINGRTARRPFTHVARIDMSVTKVGRYRSAFRDFRDCTAGRRPLR